MLRLSIELVLCLLLVYGWSQHKCKLHWLGRQVKGRWKARREKRFLKAKTPCDCPLCQDKQDQAAPVPDATANYAYEKTKRGRPKRVNSEGFACLNPACRYYLIRSAERHALVADGRRGKAGDIQRWRCQGCQCHVSGRRHTALFGLKKPRECIETALRLLCVGVSRSQVAQGLGVDERTVAGWLERAGQQGQRLHEHFCQQQQPKVVQLDELMVRVRTTVKRWWVWLAIDPKTKILLALHVGSRKTPCAMRFVHALVATLAPGYSHSTSLMGYPPTSMPSLPTAVSGLMVDGRSRLTSLMPR